MIAVIILKFAFDIKLKDIKRIKQIGYDKNLNEITNALPENKVVCEQILEKLDNTTVKIEEVKDTNKTLTYYSVITNHIMIADIKDTFTRIQTIAHECIHSVQNRSILWFNFVFSNIYFLYFVIISILTIFKVISMPMIHVAMLLLLGIIYYAIRSFLETDAMTRAPYLSKEYIKEAGTLSSDNLEKVIHNYEILNRIGIPMTNFALMVKIIGKVMIYCIIAIFV